MMGSEERYAWMRARMARGRTRKLRVRREHGTRSAYTRGCRCPECVDANRRYGRRYAATHLNIRRMPWPAELPLEHRQSFTMDSLERIKRAMGVTC